MHIHNNTLSQVFYSYVRGIYNNGIYYRSEGGCSPDDAQQVSVLGVVVSANPVWPLIRPRMKPSPPLLQSFTFHQSLQTVNIVPETFPNRMLHYASHYRSSAEITLYNNKYCIMYFLDISSWTNSKTDVGK